jgi:hypothetical protein
MDKDPLDMFSKGEQFEAMVMWEHQSCIRLLESYFLKEITADFTIEHLHASIQVIVGRLEGLGIEGQKTTPGDTRFEKIAYQIMDSIYDFESTVKTVEALRIREGREKESWDE